MPTETTTYRGRAQEVRALVRTLPAVLSGRAPDPHGFAREVGGAIANKLLELVQAAFVVKSRGEQGPDGVLWPPLQPATIARKLGPEVRKRLGRAMKVRAASAKPSAAKRKAVYNDKLSSLLLAGVPRARARELAGRHADRVAAGVGLRLPERLRALGFSGIEILVETTALQVSFAPGVSSEPSGAPGQVFRVKPGEVVVGTQVKPWHHFGAPSRNLPARRYWPADGLPASWWGAVLEAASAAIMRVLRRALAAGRV
jgi:hypothetical protein